MRALAIERRWISLLRSRRTLLGVVVLGGLAVSGILGVAVPPGLRAESVFQVTAYAAVLVPLILGQGMISADLRSGVSLLWLQKPVDPVLFYFRRACEVTALSVALALAVWGAGACVLVASAGPEPARELLSAAPGLVLIVVCVSALTFAFSSWGTPADGLLVVVFFFASTFSLLIGGRVTAALEWIALPVEAIGAFARGVTGEPAADLGGAALEVGRFLLVWGLVGGAGLEVSTRSPLPRDAAR
jgi:hypothetical protein